MGFSTFHSSRVFPSPPPPCSQCVRCRRSADAASDRSAGNIKFLVSSQKRFVVSKCFFSSRIRIKSTLIMFLVSFRFARRFQDSDAYADACANANACANAAANACAGQSRFVFARIATALSSRRMSLDDDPIFFFKKNKKNRRRRAVHVGARTQTPAPSPAPTPAPTPRPTPVMCIDYYYCYIHSLLFDFDNFLSHQI